jgi:RNA polymerase sigma factor (sigma-70 family)
MNTTDAELLSRFVASRDEAAFRGIVERHAPMVHGVAWRRTQDQALAQDITQTVFTILARKAPALHHSELAGWLHRAAFMETRNVCRKNARLTAAMQAYTTQQPNADMSPDDTWKEIQPHLDEALSHLPAEERQLVVMRYFEQRSYREIADTTGKTEEASRKRMQRSLDRLGAFLRRKGIITSGAALGALLSAQTLCVPAASAAVISSAALQGAHALTASTIFSHTLYTMTASTVLKTSIVTLALAAIPVAYLWRENSSLKQEVRELRLASPHTPAEIPASGRFMAASEKKTPNNKSSAKTASPAPAAKQGDDPAAAFAGLLSGDNVVKMATEEMKKEAAREVNRLALRLKLTPEQKQQLQEFLEGKNRIRIEELKRAVASGAFTRAMKGGEDLTPEDHKIMADLDATEHPEAETDAFLANLLTAAQQQEYAVSKEEKRVADAEESAHDALTAIGKQVDLTADQKDRLFQALAQRKLAAPPKPASAGESGVAFSLGDAMPQFDKSNDEVLRSILTAEQFQAYEKSREEDERATKEMLKTVAPWLPQKAAEQQEAAN